MKAALAKFVTLVLTELVLRLLTPLLKAVQKWIAEQQQKRADESATDRNLERTLNAETEAERIEASRQNARNTRS